MSACCGPSADRAATVVDVDLPSAAPRRDAQGMVLIPGGEFLMGGDDPDAVPEDGEGPVRTVRLSPYLIDATAVTNRRFAAFVKATGYVTDAERFGWSFVFGRFVAAEQRPHVLGTAGPGAPWWFA